MSWTHTETPKENVKLATTKTLTSKPLPTLKLERIGHLYALVIVQNRGKTPANIQRALYTLENHLVEKHDICGYSLNSCWYYQRTQALSAQNASIIPRIFRIVAISRQLRIHRKDVDDYSSHNSFQLTPSGANEKRVRVLRTNLVVLAVNRLVLLLNINNLSKM